MVAAAAVCYLCGMFVIYILKMTGGCRMSRLLFRLVPSEAERSMPWPRDYATSPPPCFASARCLGCSDILAGQGSTRLHFGIPANQRVRNASQSQQSQPLVRREPRIESAPYLPQAHSSGGSLVTRTMRHNRGDHRPCHLPRISP